MDSQVADIIFLDEQKELVPFLDGFEHFIKMIQVQTNIKDAVLDKRRKMVQVKVVGMKRQVDQCPTIRIHHAEDDFLGRDFKTRRLDNIV
jgi:hypothetical protein